LRALPQWASASWGRTSWPQIESAVEASDWTRPPSVAPVEALSPLGVGAAMDVFELTEDVDALSLDLPPPCPW